MTITAIYSDEGAEVVNYLSRMFVKWEVFSHYVESSEVFLLYTDRDQYVYVPKRVMTPDQVVSFRELMSRQVMLTRYQRRAAQGFPVEGVSAAAARAEARDNSPPSR
jgi:hypothetical protein